uniref:alcohol dehydrogenase n=1 Tax=Arcella intermedia TaxID=1963864 RepID=A0A6B2L8D9_9EUKA
MPNKLEPNQLLVKNMVATICGSDLHTWRGRRSAHVPLVLGHEGMGKIIGMGEPTLPQRKALKIGDRVTWSIFDRCFHCMPCTAFNIPQKCDNLFKYGHTSLEKGNGLDGCYSSHTLVRGGTHVVSIPDCISNQLAAPLNCAFSTIHAALDLKKFPEDTHFDTALVLGAGLLGLYTCIVLRHLFNVSKVFITDKNPEREQMATKFGAIPVPSLETDSQGFIQKFNTSFIQQQTKHGVDIVVETCGDPEAVPDGIHLLRFGGHFVMVGLVHPKSSLGSLTGYEIIHKCATIHGIHNYGPEHLDRSISFLSSVVDQYPFHELVSAPLPLSAMDEAFDLAASQKWSRVCVDLE